MTKEVNLGAELNKMGRISQIAADALEFHKSNMDKPNAARLDMFEHIKQIKREILELLAPIEFYVVYKRRKGGLEKEPVYFLVNPYVADYCQDREFDNNEEDGLEFFVEKEELR